MPLTREQRARLFQLIDSDPVKWIERHFYVPDPRDPITGEWFPPGPLRLFPGHAHFLREGLLKGADGNFRYTTILFSTIKKSGKTTIGAAVAAWFAASQGGHNEVYCLANDGKQSADRILTTVKDAVDLSPTLDWHQTKTRLDLPNRTFIEAIPCDAAGSAGAQPSLTVWSEVWGYTTDQKKKLYAEMTPPPTRHGRAIRWVESYAGYRGESEVLWDLYETGVMNGRRHPAFPVLPVYVNERARQLTYWDEGDAARRMPWQRGKEGDEYYAQQAEDLIVEEFERLHKNHWVEPLTKAIPLEWWDACQRSYPPLDARTPCVAGVDASVSGACTACVLVSLAPRDPARPKKKRTRIHAIRITPPPPGGKINLQKAVGDVIRGWHERYNLKVVVYDEFQLHDLMQQMRLEKRILVRDFSQRSGRLKADKQCYDMVVSKDIEHKGDQDMRTHVDHAQKKSTDERTLRFVALDEKHPIDGLVALSMANHQICHLIL
jgi:hypothetical protein